MLIISKQLMSNNLSILNRRNQYLIVNRRYLTSHIQNTII